jgi:hypothetical protein
VSLYREVLSNLVNENPNPDELDILLMKLSSVSFVREWVNERYPGTVEEYKLLIRARMKD